MFVAVDGIDGAGKTTLARHLQKFFAASNPLVTKEPTADSEWGLALRDSAKNGRLPREIEIEYFHRDRVEHIKNVIKPALAAGRMVISDRYVDSTLAYQCKSPKEADSLYRKFLPEILVPDLTFILDCAVDTGLRRVASRNNGTSSFENHEVLETARIIFASRKESHHVHIDASRSAHDTFQIVIESFRSRFPDFFEHFKSRSEGDETVCLSSPIIVLA